MQAIRAHEFGPAEVMKLEETADPVAGAGQVVVRLHAIGVNPVDTYILAGKHGQPQLPFTPGKDGAGVIEAVGEHVKGRKVGERVYVSNSISGTYADRAVCDAATVHSLPDKVSFAGGACLGVPAGVAYFALFFRAEAEAGETVLIHGGTGAVGTAAIQFACAAGMTVLATAGDEEGRRFVLQQGAHEALEHDITKYPERVKTLTDGRGVDVIVEMAAGKNLGDDLGVLAERGRIAVIGSRSKVEIDPRLTMQRNADIRGVTLERLTHEEHQGIYAAISAALTAGTLRPVVALELPLAEAVRAHKEVLSHHAPGNVILRPAGAQG